MKKFIFDEYQGCINPNRLEVGNSEFYIEITTAFHDGKWYASYWYWTKGKQAVDEAPHLNTNAFETEEKAICHSAECAIKLLEYENKSRHGIDVPDFIFKELKDIKEKNNTPQLTLNF